MGIDYSAFKDYLFHVTHIVFRVGYGRPFSERWDRQLVRIINAGKVESVNKHTIVFSYGGDVFEVWTSNRWYAYAHLWSLNGKEIPENIQARPRFSTMRELHEVVKAFDYWPQNRKEFYQRLEQMSKAHD